MTEEKVDEGVRPIDSHHNPRHEIIREVIRFLMEYEKQCIKERKRYDKAIKNG